MCNLGEALYEDAKQEGMEEKLKRLIKIKLDKGMNLSDIAELLEEEEDYIRELAAKLN